MSFDIGFNFRLSSGFVTDPADTTYSLGETYPTTRSMVTSGLSVTFGWDQDLAAALLTRDRNSGIDARLAGGHRADSAAISDVIFRIDLPASGAYQFRLAMGDASNAVSNQWTLFNSDGTTTLASQSLVSVSAGNWYDASGVNRTSGTDWVTNNAPINVTFSGTVAFFKMFTQIPASEIAHLRLFQATAASNSPIVSTTRKSSRNTFGIRR